VAAATAQAVTTPKQKSCMMIKYRRWWTELKVV